MEDQYGLIFSSRRKSHPFSGLLVRDPFRNVFDPASATAVEDTVLVVEMSKDE